MRVERSIGLLRKAGVLGVDHNRDIAALGGDQHGQLLLILADFLKYAAVTGKRTGNHIDLISDLEGGFCSRSPGNAGIGA